MKLSQLFYPIFQKETTKSEHEPNQLKMAAGIAAVMLVFAAASRFLPHPPNFTPLVAMALFAGAILPKNSYSWLFPLVLLFITDVIIGFHNTWLSVYGSFLVIGILGTRLGSNPKVSSTLGAVLGSGLLFFIVTNFQVFMLSPEMYERSWAGLITCYTLALPFYRNMLAADLLYTAVLFAPVFLARYMTSEQNNEVTT